MGGVWRATRSKKLIIAIWHQSLSQISFHIGRYSKIYLLFLPSTKTGTSRHGLNLHFLVMPLNTKHVSPIWSDTNLYFGSSWRRYEGEVRNKELFLFPTSSFGSVIVLYQLFLYNIIREYSNIYHSYIWLNNFIVFITIFEYESQLFTLHIPT